MTTEIAKIDPKKFGLQETQVAQIQEAFMPKIVERDGLAEIYSGIITQEITPALCTQAGDLRKKLVKVRTGIAEIHKVQKAFYLAAGRYVDAWKNKETLPVTQMEENLSAIEEHYDRIEAEKQAKLQEERSAELLKYSEEGAFIPDNLGQLLPEVWNNYLLGVKTAYETKKENERKAAEEEATRVAAEKAEQERIKQENEKLKADAKKLEDQKEKEKEEKDKRFELRKAELLALGFTYDENKEYNFSLSGIWSCFWEQIYNPDEKMYLDYVKAIKQAIEKHNEKERIQKELEAKAEAERKAAADAELAKQAELAKGDADKVLDLITELSAIRSKYTFKSKKNKAMYEGVGQLCTKIINYINEYK